MTAQGSPGAAPETARAPPCHVASVACCPTIAVRALLRGGCGAADRTGLAFRRRLLRGPGDYAQFCTEGIGDRRDQGQLRAWLARSEQAADDRGVAVNATGQLSLGNSKITPQLVELPDQRVGLGDLPGGALIRRPVLRFPHPARPAPLLQAHIEHLVVSHGHPARALHRRYTTSVALPWGAYAVARSGDVRGISAARRHSDADRVLNATQSLSVTDRCSTRQPTVESVVESMRRFLGAIGAFRASCRAVRAGRWASAASRAYGKEKVYGLIP